MGMRFSKVMAVLLVSLFCYALAEASHVSHQKMIVGRTSSIEVGYEIGDVAISDYRICDFLITDNRREVYLNPLAEGVATLTIWNLNGVKEDVIPITVERNSSGEVVRKIKQTFQNTNVDVVESGNKILLGGEVASKSIVEQANIFASKYPQVESEVKLSNEIVQVFAAEVEKAIKTPGIKVRNIRGKLVLEGVAYSASEAKRAERIAKLYDPGIVNLLDVRETNRRPGRDDLVKIDVYFMEIKKEILKSIGVRWAPGSMPSSSSSGASGLLGSVSNLGTTLIGFVMNFLPKLKTLNEKGYGRVLEHASLLVKSGSVGDFVSGTQVPYYSAENVSFKDVGVSIHVEPITSGNDIDLDIKASLNSLAANIEAGIDTRTFSTSAYVPQGQALVLANIVSNRDVKTYNKKPSGIDTSTAIFNFFKSKDFQSGKSEFTIFVVPSVYKTTSSAEASLRKYLSIEDNIIKDRSDKEYEEHLFESGRTSKKQKVRRNRRKWR